MSSVSAEEEVVFQADYETVIAVLTGTWEYPRFIPGLRKATVLHRDERSSEVRYDAGIAFFEIPHTMRMERTGPDELVFRQIRGVFREVEGSWRRLASTSSDETVMLYSIRASLPFGAPKPIVNLALRSFFPRMLESFRREVHRVAGRPPSAGS